MCAGVISGKCFAGNSGVWRGVWILQAGFVQVLSNWCIHIPAGLLGLCNNGASREMCVGEVLGGLASAFTVSPELIVEALH